MNLDVFDLFASAVTPAHVSQGGAPAKACPCDGMPAYESESGRLLVMECLICFCGVTGDRTLPLLFPRSYDMAMLRGPGLVALHDDPDAVWTWRPIIYDMMFTHTQRKGSQQELLWRRGVHDARMAREDLRDRLFVLLQECVQGRLPFEDYEERAIALADAWPDCLPFQEAEARADRILREHLNPQQLLDLAGHDWFYVRGNLNRLYRVEIDNGCQVVHPSTHAVLASLCIHTDDWIPGADVALATKLMIDAGPETEAELLAGAKATPYAGRTKAERWERWCGDAERDLHPAPMEAAA